MLKTSMEVLLQLNDTSKTANITDTIFDRATCDANSANSGIVLTSDGVLKIGEIRRSVSC